MRISKIIVALLVSVVALAAMTGVAVAGDENLDVEPGPKSIPYCPNSVVYNVQVYDIEDLTATHAIKATTNGWGSGASTDLNYKFTNESGANSGWISSGVSWNWGKPSHTDAIGRGYEALTLEVCAVAAAPQNNAYSYEVFDQGGTLSSGGPETASGTTTGQSIPEFATIAIPAIAVLGLFLFFNNRKHKKE